MVGKAGYYKRKQSQTKTVSQIAHVHDGELSLDENAANNMYHMAASASQPSISDALDVSDLPFFNIGRMPMPLMMSSLPAPISQSGTPQPALANQPANKQDEQAMAQDEAAKEEIDSEEEDNTGLVSESFMNHMNISKPKAKAKASSKASAKPKANPKENAASSKKRKGGSGSDLQSEVKVLKLEIPPTKVPKGNDTEEADNQLISQWQTKLAEHRERVFLCDSDNDSAVAECLKNASKALAGTATSIKQKNKSLNRRQGGGDYVISELESILNEIQDAHKLTNSLLQCSGEDTTLIESMAELSSWTFSSPLMKRALKSACISNLKFQDWKSFTGSTKARIHSTLGEIEGESFFWMMLNEFIQKMLRAIPSKKVPLTTIRKIERNIKIKSTQY